MTALPRNVLLPWLLGRRSDWRVLVEEERSRSVHAEFLLAESGMLPDMGERRDRLRATLMRGWMRHVARGLAEVWPGAPAGLGINIDTWIVSGEERLEALSLDESQRLARRGLSGDPAADRRAIDLVAYARFFGEGVGTAMGDDGPGAPAMGNAVAARVRETWGTADGGEDALGAPPDGVPADQALEMSTVWIAVQGLVEALEEILGAESPRAA